MDRKLLGTSTIGPHPARSAPAVAPRDPPRPADACRSAIGRPILPEQEIHFLSPVVCMCAVMYRIDLAQLCWGLEHLEAGDAVNVIRVDDETAKWAVATLVTVAASLAVAVPLTLVASGEARAAAPVPVIFDTDICGDCDDVAALAMLHALESREQCRLLAVTVTANHALAAPFVDGINRFYGRTEIPVGVVRPGGVEEQSVYLKLAEATQDDPAFAGKERYPHALRHAKDAPEAVAVLRRALAAAEDGSVVVVQVGFSTNLARLLDSPPDATSPLDGKALVAKKVKLLELMAGAFQPIDGNAAYEEYNVVKDRAAAAKLAEVWPTEMIWSGFEIGIALPYPSQSILEDFRGVPHHPVKESYAILSPPPQDRPSWDLTSVLDGVLGSRGYFDRSPPGKVTVTEKGATTFAPDPQGKHRYLVLNDVAARARVIEALVQLSSQPR